jgi:hypothetical protein
MAPSDHLGETWPELCARVDAQRGLERWARVEPVLAGFTELAAVAVDVHSSRDRAHVDDVFGALLRLAAADNGDDQDAALVVAHLMHKGSRSVAVSLADLSPDIDAVVATELWMQIRGYRWRHRRHSHALGLKNDTRAAVLREFAPARGGDGRRRQVSVSPELVTWLSDAQVDDTTGSDVSAQREPEDELLDVLSWARGFGVLSDDDVRLLLEFELARLPGRRAEAAAEWGLSERTVRRRCSQAKQRLHEARMAYLEHAA